MSIADAFQILNGPRDAATEYFRGRTSTEFRARVAPIAEDAIRKVGLFRTYEDIKTAYERIPYMKMPAPDLEQQIIEGAFEGLFLEVAKEEAKIRVDPAARSTELLRRGFGAARQAVTAARFRRVPGPGPLRELQNRSSNTATASRHARSGFGSTPCSPRSTPSRLIWLLGLRR
jgi:hypothetical protein